MRSVLTGFAAALALCWTTAALGQEATASMAVTPAQQRVRPEEEFEVEVTVDDVTGRDGLGGYTLALAYDPQVLRALRVTDSGYVASTENAVVCPASAIDEEEGKVALVCLTLPVIPQAGPKTDEPEVLARVAFVAVADGRTALRLEGSSLIDPSGDDIRAELIDGEISVGQGAPLQEDNNEDGGSGSAGLWIGFAAALAAVVALSLAALWFWRRRGAAQA